MKMMSARQGVDGKREKRRKWDWHCEKWKRHCDTRSIFIWFSQVHLWYENWCLIQWWFSRYLLKKRRHGGIISAFNGSSEVVSQDITSWWNFCHLSFAAGLLNIKLCRSRSSSWRRMGNPSPKWEKVICRASTCRSKSPYLITRKFDSYFLRPFHSCFTDLSLPNKTLSNELSKLTSVSG